MCGRSRPTVDIPFFRARSRCAWLCQSHPTSADTGFDDYWSAPIRRSSLVRGDGIPLAAFWNSWEGGLEPVAPLSQTRRRVRTIGKMVKEHFVFTNTRTDESANVPRGEVAHRHGYNSRSSSCKSCRIREDVTSL